MRYAEKKLKNKKLDLIVANDVSDKEIGFDSDQNEVTLITHKGKELIQRQNKKKISKKIIDFIRAYSVPTPEVNRSLAYYMDESGGDMEATAKHFLSNTGMWKKWVPADVAAKVADTL